MYLAWTSTKATWWMRVGIDSPLSSISAFSTDLKRIWTPHLLFWDFWADKTFTTRWSGGKVQFWVQVLAPQVMWQSFRKAVREDNRTKLIKAPFLPIKAALNASLNLLFIGLWVKLWHRNKSSCSKSNPVQGSRSKSMTYLRKGRLLRFKSNSTATSDGSVQKLGNDVWHDSKSIATKAGSQMGCKWNATF